MAEWAIGRLVYMPHTAARILATASAFLIVYYGPRLIAHPWLRTAVIVMFVAAFAAAVVGGAFGAFLNKIAPIV